jgi:hypothetical protein
VAEEVFAALGVPPPAPLPAAAPQKGAVKRGGIGSWFSLPVAAADDRAALLLGSAARARLLARRVRQAQQEGRQQQPQQQGEQRGRTRGRWSLLPMADAAAAEALPAAGHAAAEPGGAAGPRTISEQIADEQARAFGIPEMQVRGARSSRAGASAAAPTLEAMRNAWCLQPPC